MHPLLDALLPRDDVASLCTAAARGRGGTVVAPEALEPLLAAAIATVRPVLLVTASGREAEDLAAVLGEFTASVEFPAWETLPHERLSPSADTVGRRLAVLRDLRHPLPGEEIRVLVAPVRALLQPIVRGLGDIEWLVVTAGDQIDADGLPVRLVEFGYARTDLVERRGQFAVRGGIIDVFPPTAAHPVRIELWGDTVEEMRSFAVVDQRSLELLPNVRIGPVREVLLTDAVRERARAAAQEHPVAAELLGKIAEGLTPEGMEALAPLMVDGMQTVLDVIAPDTAVVLCEPERIRARAAELVATSQEFLEASWHNAAAGNALPLDIAGAAYHSLEELRDLGGAHPWWDLTPFASGADDEIVIAARATEDLRGDPAAAVAAAAEGVRAGQRVLWVCAAAGTADRVAEQLADAQIPVTRDRADLVGAVRVVTGALEAGFRTDDLLVVSEAEVIGQRSSTRDMRRLPSRRRATLDPLQLRPGDYVVHEQHGVGRYVDMVQRTAAGATREYLVLEYAASKRGQPADRLYVPMDQLDQVTRYVGGEAPTVHRLGGADWQKAKSRARKAVRQIAGDLIKLYAARMAARGHEFGPDTEWQRELEDAFAYVETPDQLACIDEVKRDMERPTPMDRLICGDVGYGKTEIAVRAAFKAVQDGKQVAVLVPTTLLVQQHLSTFRERFAAFPVTVAALSRFQTERESATVVEQVAGGVVDVVIGTHRLLTSGIRFKDLGLIIVDEEQRFGVEHKEHLKALRTNVDVLTMSATPIPRSLEMSITGIREMSTIQTPPEERLPVLTYVGVYDQRHVVAAIHRELMRDGQVFFVHNRVESIDRVAALLGDLVPEARIAVAHGQLPEQLLEQVIVDFWEKRTDVLVCTTIVESGLDISNANTLIVDRADLLGLSQLHQLRGRVGRGRERAYAYFLYPPERPLSEAAHDRLSTIAAYTDLGSGMQIAMKDLEIRGAGNLLGGEQSGHIADVGFDLYVRLVGEALAEVRGDVETAPAEMRIELPVDARIPETYVPQERLRLDLYRRLAAAATDADIEAVRAEMLDRFGPPPADVDRLLATARLRVQARDAGLAEIVLAGTSVRLHPVELAESAQMRLTRLYPRTVVKPAVRTILVPRPAGEVDLIEWAATLVRECLTPTRSAK